MDKEQLTLYTLYRGDKAVAYLYGEEWRAMQLLMEGGYSTPITAFMAWLAEEVTSER